MINLPLDDVNIWLANLPLLHTWDGGVTWNTGGFNAAHLAPLLDYLRRNLPESPVVLETGAGNSTIALNFLSPRRLISIAPDKSIFAKVQKYCLDRKIPTTTLEIYSEGSEWVLPMLASQARMSSTYLDFALIDGCHNWPMVFVDFFYINYMLKTNGVLMIDDIQLHSVKELARLLFEEPSFTLELDLGKALIFRRKGDAKLLGGWETQAYIARRSNEYSSMKNPFAL